jgi:prephenate dehydratase/chorismate mutase
MTNKPEIESPRAEIDRIDREMLRLLNERARIALTVGAKKTSIETSLCDPVREREVLEQICQDNPGPLDDTSIKNIFQRVIDESLHLQQKTYQKPSQHTEARNLPAGQLTDSSRIAFLGERGSFSEEAALKIVHDKNRAVSSPTFEELFGAIAVGKADLILAPVENSLIGSVRRCVGLLLSSSLYIIAEVVLPVSHYLIAAPGASFETIRTIESHPAALEQCERFFREHPDLKRIAGHDTASSVRRVVESGDPTRAAIGSRRTAEIYGGRILREHVEDHAENYTRFVLLARDPAAEGNGNKVSLVLRLINRPGSLHGALRPFVRRGIDLVKIESLPIRDAPGEFYFYLEFRAPENAGEIRGSLDEIRELTEEIRYLGRYSTIKLDDEN